jgi:hypothetical protein
LGTTGFDAGHAPAVFFKLRCLKSFDHDNIINSCRRSRRLQGNALGRQDYLEERMAALKAGEMAPEIELSSVTGKQRHKFKLSDFRGKKNVIVAFYPLDWSPT